MSFEKLDRAITGIVVRDVRKATTFLIDTFLGGRKRSVNSRANVIDFTFDQRGIAKYKISESTVAGKPEENTKDSMIINIKTIKESLNISVDDIRDRLPGQTIEADYNRNIVELAKEKYDILNNVMDRTHEKSFSELLLTGGISSLGVAMKRDTKNIQNITFTGQGKKIISSLIDYALLLRTKPNVAIMGRSVPSLMFNELPDDFLTRNQNIISFNIGQTYEDVAYVCSFDGIDYYRYTGSYTDDSGQDVSFVPDNKIIYGNKNGSGRMYYNPVLYADGGAKIISKNGLHAYKNYVSNEDDRMVITGYSNGFPLYEDINSIGVVTVS